MTIAASLSSDSVLPQEGYSRWAETYDREANPVLALQNRILRAILPDPRAKTVADLGCGTGQVLSIWREQHALRLIGIDISPEMLKKAASSDNTLIAADSCALPLASGGVDVISCCLALGYLSDLRSFVSEVARVLSPGGTILISELHPESVVLFGWRRGFGRGIRAVNIDARAFAIDEVVSAFEQHGLEATLLLEVPFGTSELPIFETAGKREQFEAFRGYPAIYVLQLCCRNSTTAPSEPITLGHTRIALSGSESAQANVTVGGTTIRSVGSRRDEGASVDLSGYLLLPGLINAHDHLEFALFPRLGRGTYHNSGQWAADIYRPDESPIREHLRVPKWVRLWWGAIRNLLCGVTTVCHHNPYDEEVFGENFPVHVIRDFAWAHSLAFDSGTVPKFRETDSNFPFVIHAAEGLDGASREEVRTLSKLGILTTRTVIVHGTGLDAEGFELLRNSGAALVWCPSSNTFLFNQTLTPEQVDSLRGKAIGSDSPLTASGDLLDEIRFAAALGASPQMLFRLVTDEANRVLRLKQAEGSIRPGAVGDLVAVRDRGGSPAETLVSLLYSDVELVIRGGRVRLVSDRLKPSLPDELTFGLELLTVDGVRRWVRAPIGQLLELSRAALGPKITMCGRSLTQ